MTGMMAHGKTESWLTHTGQVAHLGADYSMLFTKAAQYGEDKIFELDNENKFKEFKKSLEPEFRREVNNIFEIEGAVQTNIINVINNFQHEMTGWVKADSNFLDWDKMSDKAIEEIYTKAVSKCILNHYGSIDMYNYTHRFCEESLIQMKEKGIINSFYRTVEFNREDENLINVTVTDDIEYRYLDNAHKAFSKNFEATKQQAESYVVEKLLINNKDYTKQFETEVEQNDNRGEKKYYVKSKKSIAIDGEFPVNIIYRSSYKCVTLEFFQAKRLVYLCKNFRTELHLNDGLDKEYSIIVFANSKSYDKHVEPYEAKERKHVATCSVQLKECSMEGAGYVATLKDYRG